MFFAIVTNSVTSKSFCKDIVTTVQPQWVHLNIFDHN